MNAAALTRQPAVPGENCRQIAAELVCGVFARAGTPLIVDTLDLRLAAVAADAAQLYVRTVEDDTGPPLPLVTDLLTIVAALREVLGMSPTPVNAEVYWGCSGG